LKATLRIYFLLGIIATVFRWEIQSFRA